MKYSIFGCAFAVFFLTGYRSPDFGYIIPNSPVGCVTKIYGPFGKGFFPKDSIDLLSAERRIYDVKRYLDSLGMIFPEGSYAFFYGASSICVISTTPSQHKFFDSIIDPN